MKNYRFFGEEMEVLGQRLDAARDALARSKNAWSKNYWQQNIDRLMFQWRQLPILHDGDAQVTLIPRWSINYDFCERSEEPVTTIGIEQILSDKLHDMGLSTRLNESWDRHRAQRLARAQ